MRKVKHKNDSSEVKDNKQKLLSDKWPIKKSRHYYSYKMMHQVRYTEVKWIPLV